MNVDLHMSVTREVAADIAALATRRLQAGASIAWQVVRDTCENAREQETDEAASDEQREIKQLQTHVKEQWDMLTRANERIHHLELWAAQQGFTQRQLDRMVDFVRKFKTFAEREGSRLEGLPLGEEDQ
jgi:flagellar motility protein MotE (MotC chaperone)